MTRKKIYGIFLTVLALCCALTGVLLVGCDNGDGPGGGTEDEYNLRLEPSTELCSAWIEGQDVFHDQAGVFMSPLEPKDTDNVTIRLRVRRGSVSKATLQFTLDLDKISDGTAVWHDIPMLFEIADETMYYDYFICIIPAQVSAYKYHFLLENEVDRVVYNYFECEPIYEDGEMPIDCGSDFYVMPNFSTPDWAKGCLWYSIMPDSFFNGDTLNDKTTSGAYKEDAWGTTHTTGEYSGGLSYFGGDMLGVLEKLPYIRQFGSRGVFLNPIWFAYHNAGYGATDMTQIDSTFGNDNLLQRLVDTLHASDMKLMLDGVFTYFSYNGTWYNTSKFYPFPGGENEGDPYYELYFRDVNGNPSEVWGNPRVDFSDKLARELVYSTPTSVMQYYLRRHGIDGWRLDVGGDLQGSDPANWGNATQIIQDMRRYLKEINSDMLLCSEGGGGTMLTDYCLDTMWNFNYYYCVQDFLQQPTSASTVYNFNSNLYETIQALPKPVANVSYNFTSNHDMPRAMNVSGGDIAKVMGVTIVNMTFTGAPCIYFGEEVGMDGESFFDSMIWDETAWNYEIFNLYRALSSLRQDFADAYKDGAVIDLTTPEDSGLLAFARWKGTQKAVTVMNPFDDTRTLALDVRPLEWKDGTVLTDYLSGRKYTVQDGKVDLSVCRGGMVLVEGDMNGWAGKYEITRTGDKKASVFEGAKNALTLEGEGTLSGKADAFTFAHLPLFNNGGVSAVTKLGGSYALMIRDENTADAAFYALVFDGNGNVQVVYREKAGAEVKTGHTFEVEDLSRVAIERFTGNKFAAIVYENGEKSKVSESETYIAMDYRAEAGVMPVAGKSELTELSVYFTAESLSTDFSAETDSMTFSFGEESDFAVADGKLTVKGGEGVRAKLTRSHLTDFSVKTLLQSTPASGSQGVVVWQSENNFLLAGRALVEGEVKLAFIQELYGVPSVFAAVDNVAGDVTIQIEKVGFYYSAKYSTDGKTFLPIGLNLLSNFSEIYAGVASTSSTDAVFDYFCFGDAIHDGKSTADHQYYGDLNYFSNQRTYVAAMVAQSVTGGKWDYTPGGLKQTLSSASEATLSLGSSPFRGFKADFTLQITAKGAENGYVEYRFGQSNGSYGSVRLAADGTVSLLWANEILGSYPIKDFNTDTQYRFMAVMNEEQKLSLFINEIPELIIEKKIAGYTGGTHSVVGYKVAFEITSFFVYHYYIDWLRMGGITVIPTEDYVIISGNPANASLLSTGVSDFIFATNVRINKTLNTRTAQFGVLLNGLAGQLPALGGTLVSVDDDGRVAVSEKGQVLAETQAELDYQSFYFILAVKDGVVRVYIDKYVDGDENGVKDISREPVLTYEANKSLGGSLQLYVNYAKATLVRLGVYGLAPEEDYAGLSLFTQRAIESPVVKTPSNRDAFENAGTNTLSWDFTDKRQIEDFTTYEGAWYVDAENNRLVGLGTGNWQCGVTINAGVFTDYELNYKIYCHATGAWAGSLLNKGSWKDNHDDGGYLFYTNSGGNAVYFAQGGTCGSGALDEDGYLSVSIKVYGTKDNKTIAITVGNATTTLKVGTDTSTYMTDGYVSIVAGNCVAYFRDISIRKLTPTGQYA